jgi:hypothetical protein
MLKLMEQKYRKLYFSKGAIVATLFRDDESRLAITNEPTWTEIVPLSRSVPGIIGFVHSVNDNRLLSVRIYQAYSCLPKSLVTYADYIRDEDFSEVPNYGRFDQVAMVRLDPEDRSGTGQVIQIRPPSNGTAVVDFTEDGKLGAIELICFR